MAMALWVCPVVAPGVGSRGRGRRGRWEVAARVRSPPTSSSMHQTNCCPPELQSVAAWGLRQRTGSSSRPSTSTEAAGTVPNGFGLTPLSFHRPAAAPLKRFLHGDKRFYARPTTFFGRRQSHPPYKVRQPLHLPPRTFASCILHPSLNFPSYPHPLPHTTPKPQKWARPRTSRPAAARRPRPRPSSRRSPSRFRRSSLSPPRSRRRRPPLPPRRPRRSSPLPRASPARRSPMTRPPVRVPTPTPTRR